MVFLNKIKNVFAGACEASRASMEYLLRTPNSGVACVLVVGGLREAWISQPGRHVIYCSGRKGFVKLAIKYGWDFFGGNLKKYFF